MKTSYFAKYKGENGVCIAGGVPSWFKSRVYKKLAPKYWFFKKWKDGEFTNEDYIKYYYKEVLDKLDAKQVYKELGEDAVLLCYENPNDFCHRHLVAEWLEKELGIEVKEIE